MTDVRRLFKQICQHHIVSAWDANNFPDQRMSEKRNFFVLLAVLSEQLICQGEGGDFIGYTDAGKILPDLDNATRNKLGRGIPLGMPHFTFLFSLLRSPAAFPVLSFLSSQLCLRGFSVFSIQLFYRYNDGGDIFER